MAQVTLKILKYSKSISYVIWIALFSYYLFINWFPSPVLAFHMNVTLHWINLLVRSVSYQIPFTMGEWMYLILIVILGFKMFQIIVTINQNGWKWNILYGFLKKMTWFLFRAWLFFELIWGVGYHAPAPPEKLSFQNVSSYSISTLDALAERLIIKMNDVRKRISNDQIVQLNFHEAKDISIEAYQQIYSFKYPTLKKATFPILGDYIGYTAFYQPFTSEAIVRADIPALELPFTMIHELAHQNGYASEQVANFMAFMVAKNASTPLIQYSLYLQLFTYTQQEILRECIHANKVETFKQLVLKYKSQLSDEVFSDRKKIKAFWKMHSGQQIEASEVAFDQFLKWHQQQSGIQSYNEVLLWIIGYEKKFGKQF